MAAQRSVLLRGRTYTDVLPCLPAEPCSGSASRPSVGVNVVRAPDGAHFCPRPDAPAVEGVTGPCPVWSSGAYRFGTAMATGGRSGLLALIKVATALQPPHG